MINVQVYEALGSLHVTITARVLEDPLNPFATRAARSLHYSSHTSEEIQDCASLARVIQEAIDHAHAYSGDLMEHVFS